MWGGNDTNHLDEWIIVPPQMNIELLNTINSDPVFHRIILLENLVGHKYFILRIIHPSTVGKFSNMASHKQEYF